MSKKLVLLGCIHSDGSQRERAERAFALLAPKAMTLELNTNNQDATKIPIMDAALCYARDHRIPAHDVDEGFVQRCADTQASSISGMLSSIGTDNPLLQKYIREYGSFGGIPPDIRAKVLANPHLDLEKHGIKLSPDVMYDIYRRFADGSIPSDEMRAYFEGYGMQIGHPSDAIMAAHIRRIFGRHEDGTVLHVGGLFHMIELGDAPTLFRLLKDLNPERVLLADM